MAKIGPIFSIIWPTTSTDVQPAVLNGVPVICHQRNICSFISSKDIKYIKKPMRPGRKTMNEWLKMVVENQFTLEEMRNGTAYRTLKEQNVW